jgi:tetratricopeptide (TPR) repeat protein
LPRSKALSIIAFYPAGDDNVMWAYNLKGLIAENSDTDQAEVFFRKAPTLAVAHFNLGNLYFFLDKLEMAMAEYRTAIQLDHKLALGHLGLGSIYDVEGKPELAMTEFQAAIQLDRKFADAHAHLGKIYLSQQKPQMAIAEYRTSIQLDQKSPTTHADLGEIYYEQHKLDLAITEFQTALQLDPKSATTYASLGLALRDSAVSSATDAEKTKRLASACRAFSEGKKIYPDDSDFVDRMRDINSLMNGGRHCPPRAISQSSR